MTEHAPLRLLKRQTLSDDWYRLEKVTVEQTRKDGSRETIDREVYFNGPGATVLPVDPARRTVLLVRQPRVPALVNGEAPLLIEACAGIVDQGDDPLTTIRQELEQETGTRLHDARALFSLYTSPGASAEKLFFYLCEYTPADRTGRGGGLPGEGEEIEVLELPLDEACAKIGTEVIDAKTVILLLEAARRYQK
jgi:GDP-mannose pyrophosphatase NudK